MSFDPLGEYTFYAIHMKKQEVGYVVLDEQKIHFDESNNLSFAVENFYRQIVEKQYGNLALALKVTELLEEISRKMGAGQVADENDSLPD